MNEAKSLPRISALGLSQESLKLVLRFRPVPLRTTASTRGSFWKVMDTFVSDARVPTDILRAARI